MTDPADKDAEIAALRAEMARLSGPTEAIDETLDRLAAEYAVAALDVTPAQLDRCAAQLRNLMLMTAVVLAQPYKKSAEAAEARVKELEAGLLSLLRHVDNETCTHEDTYRGGLIWTICSACGCKWADDRGGFVPHCDAPAVSGARALLSHKDKTNG